MTASNNNNNNNNENNNTTRDDYFYYHQQHPVAVVEDTVGCHSSTTTTRYAAEPTVVISPTTIPTPPVVAPINPFYGENNPFNNVLTTATTSTTGDATMMTTTTAGNTTTTSTTTNVATTTATVAPATANTAAKTITTTPTPTPAATATTTTSSIPYSYDERTAASAASAENTTTTMMGGGSGYSYNNDESRTATTSTDEAASTVRIYYDSDDADSLLNFVDSNLPIATEWTEEANQQQQQQQNTSYDTTKDGGDGEEEEEKVEISEENNNTHQQQQQQQPHNFEENPYHPNLYMNQQEQQTQYYTNNDNIQQQQQQQQTQYYANNDNLRQYQQQQQQQQQQLHSNNTQTEEQNENVHANNPFCCNSTTTSLFTYASATTSFVTAEEATVLESSNNNAYYYYYDNDNDNNNNNDNNTDAINDAAIAAAQQEEDDLIAMKRAAYYQGAGGAGANATSNSNNRSWRNNNNHHYDYNIQQQQPQPNISTHNNSPQQVHQHQHHQEATVVEITNESFRNYNHFVSDVHAELIGPQEYQNDDTDNDNNNYNTYSYTMHQQQQQQSTANSSSSSSSLNAQSSSQQQQQQQQQQQVEFATTTTSATTNTPLQANNRTGAATATFATAVSSDADIMEATTATTATEATVIDSAPLEKDDDETRWFPPEEAQILEGIVQTNSSNDDWMDERKPAAVDSSRPRHHNHNHHHINNNNNNDNHTDNNNNHSQSRRRTQNEQNYHHPHNRNFVVADQEAEVLGIREHVYIHPDDDSAENEHGAEAELVGTTYYGSPIPATVETTNTTRTRTQRSSTQELLNLYNNHHPNTTTTTTAEATAVSVEEEGHTRRTSGQHFQTTPMTSPFAESVAEIINEGDFNNCYAASTTTTTTNTNTPQQGAVLEIREEGEIHPADDSLPTQSTNAELIGTSSDYSHYVPSTTAFVQDSVHEPFSPPVAEAIVGEASVVNSDDDHDVVAATTVVEAQHADDGILEQEADGIFRISSPRHDTQSASNNEPFHNSNASTAQEATTLPAAERSRANTAQAEFVGSDFSYGNPFVESAFASRATSFQSSNDNDPNNNNYHNNHIHVTAMTPDYAEEAEASTATATSNLPEALASVLVDQEYDPAQTMPSKQDSSDQRSCASVPSTYDDPWGSPPFNPEFVPSIEEGTDEDFRCQSTENQSQRGRTGSSGEDEIHNWHSVPEPQPLSATNAQTSSVSDKSSTSRSSYHKTAANIHMISKNIAHGTSNVMEALFGDTKPPFIKRNQASSEQAAGAIRPRCLLPWSVIKSPVTQMWIATIQTSQKALESTNPNDATKSLRAFSVASERQARTLAVAWAPPKMLPFDDFPVCHICHSKFAILRRACHCRNCGVCVCKDCTIQWPGKMLPETYNFKKENHVNVCKSCNWLSNEFRRSLLEGDYERATALHATGNLNLYTPFANVKGELFFPVHCAVIGGNLRLLKFLVDEHCCPVKSFQVSGSGGKDSNTRFTAIETSKGRSPLGMALENESIHMVRYLVVEKGLSIDGERNMAADVLCKNLTLCLNFLPSDVANDSFSHTPVHVSESADAAGGVPEQSGFGDINNSRSLSEEAQAFGAVNISQRHHDNQSAVEETNDEANNSCANDSSFEDCIICFENRIDCVATPCGHQICCQKCSRLISKCPVCSTDCSFMRVYKA